MQATTNEQRAFSVAQLFRATLLLNVLKRVIV